MYPFAELKTLHLELTSKCNARCPMCLRNKSGGSVNPDLPITELGLDEIKTIFPLSFARQLKHVFLCGNFGDPLAAKDTLEVLQYFKESNPDMYLEVFTNASLKSKSWWEKLASIVNMVHFSVDGLEGTNEIYRRGTNFEKISENAQAYLKAGGRGVWEFIVFKHNEHQVEEARQRSKDWGMEKFVVKKTGRFFRNSKLSLKPIHPVLDDKGDVEYLLEMPERDEYKNADLGKIDPLKEKYGSLQNYLDRTPIQCKKAKERSLYVSAEGLVFPCCWTANHYHSWHFKPGENYIRKMVSQLPEGANSLNALKHPIQEIIEGPFFQDTLPQAWNQPSIEAGKPKCCAKTCGTEFDPFQAQF